MKVVISDIPGFFPSGYTEQFYDSNRVVRLGQDKILYETDKKYIKADDVLGVDGSYQNIKIQAVIYDLYEIRFTATESVNIALIDIADSCTVELDNGEIHQARVTQVNNGDRLMKSEFREFVIEYRNLSSKQVISYLSTDNLTNNSYDTPNLQYKIGSNTQYLWTDLFPEYEQTPYDESIYIDQGVDIIDYRKGRLIYKIRMFLTDDELVNLQKYMPQNDLSEITLVRTTFDTFNPVEIPTIEVIQSDLEGLNVVEVTATKTITEEFPLLSDLQQALSSTTYLSINGSGSTVSYYSGVTAIKDFGEYTVTENTDEGLSVVSSQFGEETIKIRLYLTETQHRNVKRYMPISTTIEIVYSGTTYTSIELPVFELQESPSNTMYIMEVTLKYEQEINYPLA